MREEGLVRGLRDYASRVCPKAGSMHKLEKYKYRMLTLLRYDDFLWRVDDIYTWMKNGASMCESFDS